ELRRELQELMRLRTESLSEEAFVRPTKERIVEIENQVKRIRDLSNEYLAAIEAESGQTPERRLG
ncbi:MAG TPA: hypothetical protein VJS37_07755, partial [Terriglobales bacterium]|nr:hypothetical protein [Terriglobales bacterium]